MTKVFAFRQNSLVREGKKASNNLHEGYGVNSGLENVLRALSTLEKELLDIAVVGPESAVALDRLKRIEADIEFYRSWARKLGRE